LKRVGKDLSFVTELRCIRCGQKYSLDDPICICSKKDDGRLDISYDYALLLEKINKKVLGQRPRGVWKYFELLPVRKKKNIITLKAGATPLIRSRRLSKKLGLKKLYLKDETRNPTGSFKDRSMTVGVSKAVEFGFRTTATASSGNAAAALSAYCAKAGLRCFAFVLESAPEAKLSQIRLYGTHLFRVKAVEKGRDPTVQMLSQVVERYGWYPCPSFGPYNPYQVEGPKTITYELVEQLKWIPPDWVMIPTGSGCLLTGIWKGFNDFQNLNFIDSKSKLVAVQSEGCAPLVRAFNLNKFSSDIQPWGFPNTIAGGLSDVYPWDGDTALIALRESGGLAQTVTDEKILEAQQLLASTEGIFAEPSGVASLAGLIKLINEGTVKKTETVVVLITGSGLKDPEIVKDQFNEYPTIKPNIKDFEAATRIRFAQS
jgi:threonine synthase